MNLKLCHAGNPANPPCFFLHGFLGIKEDWLPMWHYFSQSYFCLACDLPAHAGSADISYDFFSSLSQEITRLFSVPLRLIGYSMGGRIALQLAQMHPSLYSHLILLSAHPGITDEREKTARLAKDQEWIAKLNTLDMATFLHHWYDQPLFASLHQKPDLLKSMRKRSSSHDPGRLSRLMQQLTIAKSTPVTSFHPRTLFLYGEENVYYSKLYAQLPNCVFIEKMASSGHSVHLENPHQCAKIILKWLEENP